MRSRAIGASWRARFEVAANGVRPTLAEGLLSAHS